MASQSLYRKWRSQTFEEMVGQQEIVQSLKNALKTGQLKHAYLFTGPRGTGKTSTARLLAKTVNCASPRDGEPCNTCQQCREITAGTSFNVIEIDAASNRGIDNIRDLRERIMVPPVTGKYKVYILDEAHMLTTEAFNALLKTLEEPPDYAIFVLATTEVHKMLATVISRCECHHFKRFSTRQIVDHLLFIAREEQVELERGAVELLARSAAGGMRDALSLLDQAISYAGNVITLPQVQAMLGVADPRAISKLITSIAALDSPALLYVIHDLAENGADLRQVNAQMIEYWRALMLAKAGADIATILDLTEDEICEVQQLTPNFTLEELTECARIFAQNDLMQKNQATPQLGLELAALECIELHRRVQSGQPALRQVNNAPAQVAPSGPVQAVAARPVSPASAQVTPAATQTSPSQRMLRTEPLEQVTQKREEPVTERLHLNETAGHTQVRLTIQQVRAAWDNVKKRTMQKNGMLGTYMGMCDVVGVEEGEGHCLVVVRASKPTHLKHITGAADYPEPVNWALSTEFDVPCKVRVLAPNQPYTPSQAQNADPSPAPSPTARVEKRAHGKSDQAASGEALNPPPAMAQESTETNSPSQQTPLARTPEVRENKRGRLSKEEARQQAEQNPVVQDMQRMFRATITDIQPK